MHKQLWEEYYECLKRAYNKITAERIMYPIALIALEGTTVMLKCPICISPMETYMNDNFEWYFDTNSSVMFSNESNKLIEELDNIIISPDDKKLIIYNIKSDQGGQYWCKLGDTLSTIYYLSIERDSQEINIVHPNTAPYKPHAVPEKMLSKYDLLISTTWTTWTQCSACDIVGRKNRYGYCTVSSRENIKRRDIDEQTETIEQFSSETADQTKNLNKNVITKIKMALRVFRNQLPCKSEYIPKEFLDIPDVKNRKTELMIKFCKVKCSKNEIFEVRDRNGNVLESANNSAGIYSVVQGMPIPSPPVMRTVIFKKYETKAILICPG
ncbi:uncharacterized protein LOC144469868 [Augochlora pura]